MVAPLLMLVACTAASPQAASPQAASPQAASPQASAPSVTDWAEAEASFEDCVRDAGFGDVLAEEYEYLDTMDEGGSLPIPTDAAFTDRAYLAVVADCGRETGVAGFPNDDPARRAEMSRSAVVMTSCMQDQGWEVTEPRYHTDMGGNTFLVPTVQTPESADAMTLDAFNRDFIYCAGEAGIAISDD